MSDTIQKWGWRLIRTNSLWLIGNFIYFYMAMNWILAENLNEMITLGWTSWLTLPFIFTPFTLATFSCVRQMLVSDDNRFCLKKYWKAVRKNYFVAVKQGIVYSIGVFIILSMYYYYGEKLQGVILVILGLFTIYFLFVLAYSSDREERIIHYWRNTMYLWTTYPVLTLYLVLESFLVIGVARHHMGIMLLVMPGVIILITFYFYSEMVRLYEQSLLKQK